MSPSFLRDSFAGYRSFKDGFPGNWLLHWVFFCSGIWCSTAFWPLLFLVRCWPLIEFLSHYVMSHFCYFQKFVFVFPQFNHRISSYGPFCSYSVSFCSYSDCASWISRLILFNRLGKFLAIISSTNLLFFLFSPSWTPMTHILEQFTSSYRFLGLCLFLFHFFSP